MAAAVRQLLLLLLLLLLGAVWRVEVATAWAPAPCGGRTLYDWRWG